VAGRARPNERLLCIDVSRGHERQVIPVFNGADEEPAPSDFTYITQCVVSEGLRLLLGGPLQPPWPCMVAGGEDLAYADNRIRHAGDTVDSVYECNLMSKCGIDCKNRVVQLGPTYRLEVFRCSFGESHFHKVRAAARRSAQRPRLQCG
jgi:hypothetical protein